MKNNTVLKAVCAPKAFIDYVAKEDGERTVRTIQVLSLTDTHATAILPGTSNFRSFIRANIKSSSRPLEEVVAPVVTIEYTDKDGETTERDVQILEYTDTHILTVKGSEFRKMVRDRVKILL